MTIQYIRVLISIEGKGKIEIIEDDREINFESELERYRDQIENCYRKKLKAEHPGKSVNVECLFILKNN